MSSDSIWLKDKIECETLNSDLVCDILIIGAGLSGLTTAYYLAKKGKRVVIVDASNIGHGTSGHTSAHITFQHDLRYQGYLNNFGFNKAKLIALANQEAIIEIKKIILDNNILCDLKVEDSYLVANDKKTIKKLIKEYDVYKKLGLDAKLLDNPNLDIKAKKVIKTTNQLHFNPVKYMNGLVNIIKECNCEIYANTRVLGIENKTVRTTKNKITFNKLVITTHNPIINFPGMYFSKVYQDRSYTVVFHQEKEINGMYNVIDKGGFTYRNYKDYILIGGMDHKCGKETKIKHYKSIIDKNPYLKPYKFWSAQDPITIDYLPYIGYYSKKSKDILVITGFGKWGMTNSNIAGRIICDILSETYNPYIDIYSPSRNKGLIAYKNLIVDNSKVIYNYTKGFFNTKNPKCPHMKCRMVYNEDEQSFDCPCHGSRIDINGQVIDSPAIHSLVDK